MESIKLSNQVEMPMEGFGVFQVEEQACEQVVLDAIAAGYRLIDTASSYQNEEAVGRAIRSCGVPREELYRTGRVRAIGVCNFLPDRLLDLCYNAEIRPQVNQIEHHPHYQRAEELQLMRELGVQPQAWAPFAEGLKGMFEEPVLKEIAGKYRKTPAQVILRWNVQQGVIVIPKSVHRERMEENLEIWDFALDAKDMEKIKALDTGSPSMLDTRKISEVRRVYDYLNNPVLTSL